MSRRTGKVTIEDIAIAAGVSKTTVSRYINGKYNLMREDTRRRIETAIRLSDYQPSAIARSLKTQRSLFVGVVVADITSPFSSMLISGIGNYLDAHGYIPVFVNSGDSPEKEANYIRTLLTHQVDGLIVNTTSHDNPHLIQLANSGLPVVLLDRRIDNFNFDLVTGNYHAPMEELVRHLHDQGFDRAVLFTEDYTNNSVRKDRLDGFCSADRTCFGRANPMDDVITLRIGDARHVRDEVRRVVEETPEGQVTGLVSSNSVTLVNLVYATSTLGLSIPKQVGICGPDDWDWSRSMAWDWSEIIGMGITTYKVHPYRMGVEASELLMKRIGDPGGARRTIEVPCELTVRRSTLLDGGRT